MAEGETAIRGGHLVVEDDVYIGANSVIMPVTIGRGAVIGAGILLTKILSPGASM